MASIQLNVTSDHLVVLANKLEKLSTTALPNVVRKALNDTALHVKKKTLPKAADQAFETRQKNFFKAYSRVKFAKGNQLRSLVSTVGMMDSNLKGAKNYSVKNLEKQEYGGKIESRKYTPTDTARVGESRRRLLRSKNRGALRNAKIVEASNLGKGAWTKAAIKAGVGGLIEGSFKSIVFRVTQIRKRRSGMKVKLEPVFFKRDSSSFRVSAKGFSKKAAMMSHEKMPLFFKAQAQRRFKRQLMK